MFNKLNTITSTLKYHAKQIGTGVLITGLGVGTYLGFSSVFGSKSGKSKSDSKPEEINGNGLAIIEDKNQCPLNTNTTRYISEVLKVKAAQNFDSAVKEVIELKEQSDKSDCNLDIDSLNLDNVELDYCPKSRSSKCAIPMTSEVQVNTYIASAQESPAIASLTDGEFVVWLEERFGQDGRSCGIYGQRTDDSLIPIGSVFQVNTSTTNFQQYSAISSLTDGGFVVIREGAGQDGDGYGGIYGQRYNAVGNPIGSEFWGNTYTTPDGELKIVWGSHDEQDGSDFAECVDENEILKFSSP